MTVPAVEQNSDDIVPLADPMADSAPFQVLADSQGCPVATTGRPDGQKVAMWLHAFAPSQYHYVIAPILDDGQTGELKQVSFGPYQAACGDRPALVNGGEGDDWWGYHFAYIDQSTKKAGLYYSRMDGEAWVSFPAKKIVDAQLSPQQPALFSQGEQVYLAWIQTAESNMRQLMLMQSDNGGKEWAEAQLILEQKQLANEQRIPINPHLYLTVDPSKSGLQFVSTVD